MGTLVGSVADGLVDGSTLGADAGSIGVITLGDWSLLKLMRLGVAWKDGLGGRLEQRAEAGRDGGVQVGLDVGAAVGKQIVGKGITLGDSGSVTHGHPGAGIRS
jgi:hypothetical protein